MSVDAVMALPEAERGYYRDLFHRVEPRFAAVIEGHGTRPGLSAALAEACVAILDAEMAPIFPMMEQAGTPVKCGKGCAVCCTLTIEVNPAELFAVVDYLERSLDPTALAALKARAAAADALGHGVPPLARHGLRIFCPVLDPETRACLAHAARPSGCQGYLSLDLAACERVHATTKGGVPQPVAADLVRGIVAGTRDALLDDLGLPRQKLELTAGLVAAWGEPDAEARWLAGNRVLPSAESVAETGRAP